MFSYFYIGKNLTDEYVPVSRILYLRVYLRLLPNFDEKKYVDTVRKTIFEKFKIVFTVLFTSRHIVC